MSLNGSISEVQLSMAQWLEWGIRNVEYKRVGSCSWARRLWNCLVINAIAPSLWQRTIISVSNLSLHEEYIIVPTVSLKMALYLLLFQLHTLFRFILNFNDDNMRRCAFHQPRPEFSSINIHLLVQRLISTFCLHASTSACPPPIDPNSR